MSTKVDYVYKGFLDLTPAEQEELIKKLNDYYSLGPNSQKRIREMDQRVTLGPLSTGCPCCHR